MTTAYPTALDAFSNPTSSDAMNSATVPHSAQHANANDAIEAIQTKLGTDSQPANLPSGVSFGADQGVGMLVEGAYGWRDLEGSLVPKAQGAGSPTLATFQGNLRWFSYANGEDMDAMYHIPHDYVPGSDLHLHLHWSHNGTNISGTSVINYYISYAKGHSQAIFPAQTTVTQTLTGLNLTNTPRYTHRIDEIQITNTGGDATHIDNALIEPDGLIHIHFDWATIPTITGGAGKPFGFYLDLHYQSTGTATKNKAPNFWA
jgi:hypothetical protein